MKKILFVFFILMFTVLCSWAQMGVAKIKYDEAEEYYTSKKYDETLKRLEEIEVILKSTNPKLMYLKIMCYSKILESDPNKRFKLLLDFRKLCNTYLTQYDNLPDLEDKFKGVYNTLNLFEKYPQNEEELASIQIDIKKARTYRFVKDSIDYPKAEYYFQKAMKKGDVSAQVELAFMYLKGFQGVDQNIIKAYKIYNDLSQMGNSTGYYGMANAYLNGLSGFTKDVQKGIEYLKKSSELGNNLASKSLASIYAEGDVSDFKNSSLASKYIKLAKEQGANDGDFYYYLGSCSYFGWDGSKNLSLAAQYWKQSALLGDPKGQNGLGYLYQKGEGGLELNLQTALYYYKLAAERYYYLAESNLYYMYQSVLPSHLRSSKEAKYWNSRYQINPIKSVGIYQNGYFKLY